LVTGWTANTDIANILRYLSSNGDTGYIGIGLTVVFIGAGGAVLGGLMLTRKPEKPLPTFTFREGMSHFLGYTENQTASLAMDMGVRMEDRFSPDFFVKFRNTKKDWEDRRGQ
jgi:hypothetical protein